MKSQTSDSLWIKSPLIDLTFFSFGWIVIFLAYLLADSNPALREYRWYILGFVLLTTLFHRHLTFPLVYGDKEMFKARKKTYILLPISLLILTTASILYVKSPVFVTSPLPTPVQFNQSDGLYVFTREPGKTKNIKIQFTGKENSLAEVAKLFREALAGKLAVEHMDGSLKFTPAPGTDIMRFSFGGFRGSGVRERLGLPRVSVIGWKKERPFFIFLLILSALWNFYHTLMQKQGILRVYSRKSGYGKSWLDRCMVWFWFGWLFFALAGSETTRTQVSRLATSGKFLTDVLKPIYDFIPYIEKGFLISSLALTALYFIEEFKNRHRIHWPKNIFLLSLWGIYLTFFYDFVVGFVVFGFAHAIEYLAFVNIYSKKKYIARPVKSSWMARWVRHQTLYFSIFVLVSSMVFVPWYFGDRTSLNWYIVASSFLHFLYDGWIWKVRDPKVGKPLGINYGETTSSSPQVQVA